MLYRCAVHTSYSAIGGLSSGLPPSCSCRHLTQYCAILFSLLVSHKNTVITVYFKKLGNNCILYKVSLFSGSLFNKGVIIWNLSSQECTKCNMSHIVFKKLLFFLGGGGRHVCILTKSSWSFIIALITPPSISGKNSSMWPSMCSIWYHLKDELLLHLQFLTYFKFPHLTETRFPGWLCQLTKCCTVKQGKWIATCGVTFDFQHFFYTGNQPTAETRLYVIHQATQNV